MKKMRVLLIAVTFFLVTSFAFIYADSPSSEQVKWRSLKMGMTQEQVKDILGEPGYMHTAGSYSRWEYDSGGDVTFETRGLLQKSVLTEWDEPTS